MTTGGNNPLPKDIARPEKVESLQPVGGSDQPSTSFQSLMKGDQSAVKGPAVNSPFDLARTGTQSLSAVPSLATIQTQMVHAQTTLGDLNNMLSTQGLKVKPSTKYLLGSKLGDATQQLRTVNAKVGGEPVTTPEPSDSVGPVQKFLGYISAGQANLAAAQKKVGELSQQGDHMNPAEFLLVQVKLNKAQQLLDYSSVLLSKAVDDMKTLFNVQL
ncbi:MAG: hypothetical protein KGZ39_01710 [Simkania sp.]|nr:hypothetical protein [Simkania sp.]